VILNLYEITFDEISESNFVAKGIFGAIEDGPVASAMFFNQWMEDVKATVPEGRLLVFEAKQGWKPLCQFLDIPVPGWCRGSTTTNE
jgi:hypothetical protein